ncbi:MAG: cysteine synthase A [Fermentimonas sp.]|jgi:cysteine synthase A
MKYNNILELVGNTPHIRLNNLFPSQEVWIKLEKQNPAGSIKDRIALGMIEDAEKIGILKPGTTIIEPTSGNTGVGLAFVAAIKGYRTIIVMPESMSIERRNIIQLYGAELVLSPREKGMKGAIEKAQELQNEIPNSWIAQQFENASNPNTHYHTTAQEIIKDFPEGLDFLVSGIGSGGHITGVGKALKEVFPSLKIIGVEPAESPIISQNKSGSHGIQGIGAGFIPKTLDTQILNDVITIETEEAFKYAKLLAKREGILGGISTGASIAAVSELLPKSSKDARILTFNYDTGERYLSVPNFVYK